MTIKEFFANTREFIASVFDGTTNAFQLTELWLKDWWCKAIPKRFFSEDGLCRADFHLGWLDLTIGQGVFTLLVILLFLVISYNGWLKLFRAS